MYIKHFVNKMYYCEIIMYYCAINWLMVNNRNKKMVIQTSVIKLPTSFRLIYSVFGILPG